jgi:hypothetical protein
MKEVLTDMNVKTRLGSHDTRYGTRQTNSVPELHLNGLTHERNAIYFRMVGNPEVIQKGIVRTSNGVVDL